MQSAYRAASSVGVRSESSDPPTAPDLRNDATTCDIPVMLVSGQIDLFKTGHGFETAAAFHKPLDFTAFLAKVHELTRS
jgi:hypothetical protein